MKSEIIDVLLMLREMEQRRLCQPSRTTQKEKNEGRLLGKGARDGARRCKSSTEPFNTTRRS
eukprot:848958-Prorocentrum_lima.AAC.1